MRNSSDGTSAVADHLPMVAGASSVPTLTARTSEPTRLLCAAAHLKPGTIRRSLEARAEHRFRARTPEHFVDIDAIQREVEAAERREGFRRTAHLGLLATGVLAAALGTDGWLVLIALGAVLTEFIVDIKRRSYVRTRFKRVSTAAAAPDGTGGASSTDAPDGPSAQNVVVATGFSPFVGSGRPVTAWSFTVDLSAPPKGSDRTPEPLDVADFYDEVTDRVRGIRIPGLRISDEVFVHGQDIRLDRELHPTALSRPRALVSHDVVRGLFGTTSSQRRHYRVFRIPAWEGQLVMSAFFRVSVIGNEMFVECSHFLLPPIKPDLSDVDRKRRPVTLSMAPAHILVAALKAPFMMAGTALWLMSKLDLSALFSDNRYEKEVLANEDYDYAWPQSLREEWSDKDVQRYFQLLDREMYVKVLGQRMLNAIAASLEARGISTEDLEERGTTILNHGVIVQGGNVQTESLAVGTGARAVAQKAVAAVRSGGTAP